MAGMSFRDPARVPPGTEFGVVMTDDTMEPYLKKGEPVFAARPGPLAPGDVGIFLVDNVFVCRQYLEDSEGNAYLFPLNRARRELDRTLPAGDVTLFARVLMPERAPLPELE